MDQFRNWLSRAPRNKAGFRIRESSPEGLWLPHCDHLVARRRRRKSRVVLRVDDGQTIPECRHRRRNRGRRLWNQLTRATTRAAVDCDTRATEIDPRYALA